MRGRPKVLLLNLAFFMALSFLVTENETTSGREYRFVGLSTHYQSYHDAFVQDRIIKAPSSIACVRLVGRQEVGTQEDQKIAFIYDEATKDCRVGKVPLQLVKVIKDLEALNGPNQFIDNGSSQKLYICPTCMKDWTKIVYIGGNGAEATDVIDLASTSTTCAPLPAPAYGTHMMAVFLVNDNLAFCGGLFGSTSLDACFELSPDKTTWNPMIRNLEQTRGYAVLIQRDFNHYWIMGGRPTNVIVLPFPTFLPNTEVIKNGVLDPASKLVNHLPAQLSNMFNALCTAQLDLRTMFFVGGHFGNGSISDSVGLLDLDTGAWTDLPKLQRPLQGVNCGYFRNTKGEVEVVVHGGEDATTSYDSTEIYNPKTKTKRPGNPSTADSFCNYNIVQFDDYFLVVGGQVGDHITGNGLDKIYKFDPATENFVLMTQKVAIKRFYPIALLVPDSLTNCS